MISLLPLTKMFTFFALLSAGLVALFSYLLSFFGIDNYSEFRILTSVCGVLELLLLYLFFAGWRKIWKVLPILNKWIFPDLNGEWDATIDWNWRNGEESKQGIKKGKVYINQSLLKFSVDLETDESESSTLVVKPFKDKESNQAAFYYMYRSESINKNAEHNGDYKGAAILKLPHNKFDKMSGNYFTDRNTFGRYTFVKNKI